MSGNPEYWAFISYSHKDRRWCDWLHRSVETYSIPGRLVGRNSRDGSIPRRIFPIFRDRDELPSSADLNGSVVDALQRSRYLIVICSPHAVASRWVNEEIRRFRAMGRTDRILCLIVDGEPAECFPPALFGLNNAGELNASQEIEPLAADLREGHDSAGDAKLKIIAGLLGLSFDELKQREELRRRQGLIFGIAVGSLFTLLLLLPDLGLFPGLRLAAFDAYQSYFPRVRESAPAVIVAIDDASLARVGQWPWSRDTIAQLVTRVAARNPAVIGVDILFPEPDRLSPERLAESFRAQDPLVAERLANLRPHDALLAESIRSAPVVLGIAATHQPGGSNATRTRWREIGPKAPLYEYAGALRSVPELDRAAAGHGLLNAPDSERGTVRRALLVARLGEEPVLSLTLECLRIASGADLFTLESNAEGLRQISIGELGVPSQPDGSMWLRFSPPDPNRYISAVDVLEGRDDPALLERRIVFLGVTGVGVVHQQISPRGESMPSVEIHAQLVENILDDSSLFRPAWARLAEALTFAVLAAAVIVWVPRVPPRWSFGVPFACSLLLGGSGISAYLWGSVLFDWATPIAAINILFAASMTYSHVVNALRQSIAR